MTDEERERDTLPPGAPSGQIPIDPPMLTEQQFRHIMTDVVGSVVGSRMIELATRMSEVERRVDKVETAVERALVVRQVLPFILSLFSLATSILAIARVVP